MEVFRADLCNSRELARAFESVDVVVHLAAVASGGEDAPFARTVVGTERFLDAMATSACRRLVLCSTFSVYDFRSTRGVLDEDSPLHHAPDVYACDGYTISKWRQERVTRRFADTHGWDLTVLRPGFIWGRDRAYLASLGQAVRAPSPGHRPADPHADDARRELRRRLRPRGDRPPRSRDMTFNVLDGPGERIWTYLCRLICAGRGERGWRVTGPLSARTPPHCCGSPTPPPSGGATKPPRASSSRAG